MLMYIDRPLTFKTTTTRSKTTISHRLTMRLRRVTCVHFVGFRASMSIVTRLTTTGTIRRNRITNLQSFRRHIQITIVLTRRSVIAIRVRMFNAISCGNRVLTTITRVGVIFRPGNMNATTFRRVFRLRVHHLINRAINYRISPVTNNGVQQRGHVTIILYHGSVNGLMVTQRNDAHLGINCITICLSNGTTTRTVTQHRNCRRERHVLFVLFGLIIHVRHTTQTNNSLVPLRVNVVRAIKVTLRGRIKIFFTSELYRHGICKTCGHHQHHRTRS